jgi:hypothetical protein
MMAGEDEELEAGEGEQADPCFRLELDQDVDIAPRMVLTPYD